MRKPIRLKGVNKQIIWGGKRLAEEYGKGTPGESIAESWELTCRPDGINTVVGGKYDGRSFEEYIKENPSHVSGSFDGGHFPLLIKLIDAEADLSIQVHPDDAYAAEKGLDAGKTEMWYIVDAAPDAHIIYGLKEGVTPERVRSAIETGTLEELMNYVPVKKGDCFFIPAGMVHAICHGILIAEIQQNSNTTYRVYDYNRRQPDGSLRQLHVEDALAVLSRFDPNACVSKSDDQLIASCPFFNVIRIDLSEAEKATVQAGNSFVHLLCVEGSATMKQGLHTYEIKKGDSWFIPAGSATCKLTGDGTVIATTLGEQK